MRSRIFVGSSREQLEIAEAVQSNLEHVADVTIWSQNVFKPSNTAIEDLVSTLENFDFAIFVFTPDDILTIRDEKKSAVRDNVVFELGLFIGHLGRQRVFFLVPSDAGDLRIPTDLLGITPGLYISTRQDNNLIAATATFCSFVKSVVKNFAYDNLKGLEFASKEAKRIAFEKGDYWKQLLLAELIQDLITPLSIELGKIMSGRRPLFKKLLNDPQFFDWLGNTVSSFHSVFDAFDSLLLRGLTNLEALESSEQVSNYANDVQELSKVTLKLAKEVNRVDTRNSTEQIGQAMEILRGWGPLNLQDIEKLPEEIRRVINLVKVGSPISDEEKIQFSVSGETLQFDKLTPILNAISSKYGVDGLLG